MRWVDLFVIDTFLASGHRVPDAETPRAPTEPPLGEGTERIQRIDRSMIDQLDEPLEETDVDDFEDVLRDDDGVVGDDEDGDEWDAETLDEIPEELEILDSGPQIDDSALWPVHAVVLRRSARAARRLS